MKSDEIFKRYEAEVLRLGREEHEEWDIERTVTQQKVAELCILCDAKKVALDNQAHVLEVELARAIQQVHKESQERNKELSDRKHRELARNVTTMIRAMLGLPEKTEE